MHPVELAKRRSLANTAIRDALESIAKTLSVKFPEVRGYRDAQIAELWQLEAWASVCGQLVEAVEKLASGKDKPLDKGVKEKLEAQADILPDAIEGEGEGEPIVNKGLVDRPVKPRRKKAD